MSGLLGKIPKFTLKLPTSLVKAGRTMSQSPLELSCTVCEDNSTKQSKPEEGLQVNLSSAEAVNKTSVESFDNIEKAEEEKSEKDDNMEVTCSVSVDGQENQEFSFTLYDFDSKKRANKQDVEKIVVRSICEALGKTLKLPPSGSRTIKVKLAISPESSKDMDPEELLQDANKWLPEFNKQQDYDSSKSGNTASTYLFSSTTDKPERYCNVSTNHQQSPKLRPVRHHRLVSLQRQEVKNGIKDHVRKVSDPLLHDNRLVESDGAGKAKEDLQAKCKNPQHLNRRVHALESRERRNHYLDLAGVENDAKNSDPVQKPIAEPGFVCPYKILDRTHVCTKTRRNVPTSPSKSSPFKDRTDASLREDLLNLNFDPCEFPPPGGDPPFDWDKVQHRRSKSYDLHASSAAGLYSPKLKPRPTNSGFPKNHSSPLHHFRFRHRDKERQRAMQQVANWIAKEHAETQYLCGKLAESGVTDRPEQRHLHEHVHHHYHHFVDF